jgi:hypothetical protein
MNSSVLDDTIAAMSRKNHRGGTINLRGPTIMAFDFEARKPVREPAMNHVLHPGKSLSLHQGDKDEVQNHSEKEGDYTIGFNTHPLIVKHTLKAGHHVAFVVPEGGVTIANDGHVDLTVTTPK